MTDLRYDSWTTPSGGHVDRTPPLSRAPLRRGTPPEVPAPPPYQPETPRAPAFTSQLQTAINWSGAALSVALVVGVVMWGYKLTVRDVSGVPVVRALEGPMRIAPEDPGGRQAAYRGLSVNAVAAGDGVRPPADEIALAPPPVALDDPLPEPRNVAQTMAGATAGQQPPSATMPGDAARPTGPGLARSPIPPARPGGDLVAEAAAQAAVAALTGRTTREIDVAPESLTAGTRLVQLGAFDSPEEARAEWDRLARRFAPLLEGRGRVVQQAESGGRSFYRLRAHGFAEEADARQFCAALVAENATCIPVLLR